MCVVYYKCVHLWLSWKDEFVLLNENVPELFRCVYFLSRLVDQASGTEIASFPIYKVLFCARGQEGSVESDCFSFTESYRSSEEFQIHVFSCHIKEAVRKTCGLNVSDYRFREYTRGSDGVEVNYHNG